MPFIEDRRQELLLHLEGKLHLPWQTTYKQINDARDLEISHIEQQVNSYGLRLPPALHDVLPKLTMMRNQLAHLEVVSASTLEDPTILKVEHGVAVTYVPPRYSAPVHGA